MKKRCIVVTHFAKGQVGCLDFSYRIHALAKHYQVTVISKDELHYSELKISNVTYVVHAVNESRLGWLSYLWACARFINGAQPDFVVLLDSAVAPVSLLTSKRIKTVVYWNEHPTHFAPVVDNKIAPKNLLKLFIQKLMFKGARHASVVMPIGEAHYEDLIAHGCNVSKTHLIYMGVNNDFLLPIRSAIKNEQAVIQLIYIGSVRKDRGRDVMLEAIHIANQQKSVAHLTIVGASDAELEYCNNYARQLGIEQHVSIVGRIPGSEIPAYLQHADVGICLWEDKPWWRFNPPTKLFEYLVSGLPVLASNIRTHTQYIQDWQNGLIFEYDSKSLAEAIASIHERQQELPQLKSKAAYAGQAYLWERIEPEFLNIIESTIA